MIVGMFVTSHMLICFVGEVFLLHFLNGLHPQRLTFSLAITLILLNISTANDSTFTVSWSRLSYITLYITLSHTVDGGWTDWSSWAACTSQSCSQANSAVVRTRTCTNPAPFGIDALNCTGDAVQETELGMIVFLIFEPFISLESSHLIYFVCPCRLWESVGSPLLWRRLIEMYIQQ